MPSRRLPKRWSATPVRTTVLPAAEADREAEAAELLWVRTQLTETLRSVEHRVVSQRGRTGGAWAFRPMLTLVAASRSESVQVAFALGVLTSKNAGAVGLEPLIERALDVADAEGVVWTPLLDALASNGWQDQVQMPAIRLRRMASWVADQTSEEALLPLRTVFRSAPLGVMLATHVPPSMISPDWGEWALRFGDRSVVRALWANPGLTEVQRVSLVDEAVAILTGPEGQTKASPRWNAEALLVSGAFGALGEHLTDAQVARLANAARVPRGEDAGDGRSRAGVLETVLMRNATTPEWVLQEMLDRDPEPLAGWTLATHPNAPLSYLREMARNTSAHLEMVARNPRAVRDPEVRAELARSSSVPVMRALVASASPSEVGPLFQRLLARNPMAALDVILEEGLPDGADIRADILTPVLSHTDHAVRLKAFLAVHRLTLGERRPEPAGAVPPLSSPSGRDPVRSGT